MLFIMLEMRIIAPTEYNVWQLRDAHHCYIHLLFMPSVNDSKLLIMYCMVLWHIQIGIHQ